MEASISVLSLDVGTGGTRAVVVDGDGRVLAAATAEHAPFASPRTAWAEQQPQDWWRAARVAIHSALATSGAAARSIQAIGLSGQMPGSVLLDDVGLYPALQLIAGEMPTLQDHEEPNVRSIHSAF